MQKCIYQGAEILLYEFWVNIQLSENWSVSRVVLGAGHRPRGEIFIDVVAKSNHDPKPTSKVPQKGAVELQVINTCDVIFID